MSLALRAARTALQAAQRTQINSVNSARYYLPIACRSAFIRSSYPSPASLHSFSTELRFHFSTASSSSSSSGAAIELPSSPEKPALTEHAEAPHDAQLVPTPTKAVETHHDSAAAASATGAAAAAAGHFPEQNPPPAPEHHDVETAEMTAEAKKKAQEDAAAEEVERTTFAPIPTSTSQPDLKTKKESDQEESPASIPKLPSSDTVIRGTLWFDNMYPMRVHFLDMRYLVATHNHNVIIPKLFAKAFGIHGFRLIGATPRANEGGVFVHFEVIRQGTIRTPEDVTHAIITLLRAKPVHALLTPKAVRCHLVKGAPFLDDMASRFPYNRLKIELKGPNTALSDLTIEQLYNELVQFGKIFDLTLSNFEKDKPRVGSVQYVRMYSAVGARNCLHRLRLSVPLTVNSLPASVPPKTTEETSSQFTTDGTMKVEQKPLPPPTADAILYLSYDSILKTSYVTDFFVKHPRIMVPLLGFLFAAFTFLIFDPLRSFNITNYITQRFALNEIYDKLPWPFSWIRKQATNLGNSSVFQMLRHGVGMDATQGSSIGQTWSARMQDENKVRKWMHSKPDRLLFITGSKGVGKAALVKKLTSERENVVMIDIAHIVERNDEEFVKGFASSVGFAPGFALLTWLSNIMDLVTPGASKASGSSTASSAQILKILECTSTALVNIAHKEQKRLRKEHARRFAKLSPEMQKALQELPPPPPTVAEIELDDEKAKKAAEEAAKAASLEIKEKETMTGQLTKFANELTAAVGLKHTPASPSTPTPAASKEAGGAASSVASPAGSATSASSVKTPTSSAAGENASVTTDSSSPSSGGSQMPVSGQSSVMRLNDPEKRSSVTPVDMANMTEQQRNYYSFKQQQKLAKKAAAGTNGNGNGQEGEDSASSSPESNAAALALIEGGKDNLPLFVIDGFNVDNAPKHSNFMQVLVSWASEMSAAGVARFIFLTDSTLEEQVAKALPDVKMAEVQLSDASPQAAQEFLFNSLPPYMRREIPDNQTIAALQILGGRYSDLVTLVRGVENGTHPIETVEEIVVQNMNAVKGLLFAEDKTVKWNKVQMWQTINMLVNSPTGAVLYDDALFNIFSGDDGPLKAMVRNDVLRIEPALSKGGDRIKAGSPVMNEAFKRLVHHQSKLKPGMDLLVIRNEMNKELSKLKEIEEELVRLNGVEVALDQSALMSAGIGYGSVVPPVGDRSSVWGRSSSVSNERLNQRQTFLVQLLHDSHTKIAGLDVKRRQCEKEIKNIQKVE